MRAPLLSPIEQVAAEVRHLTATIPREPAPAARKEAKRVDYKSPEARRRLTEERAAKKYNFRVDLTLARQSLECVRARLDKLEARLGRLEAHR